MRYFQSILRWEVLLMEVATVAEGKVSLEAIHLEDIRLAASKMTGGEPQGVSGGDGVEILQW
jgi:hypothetical protein